MKLKFCYFNCVDELTEGVLFIDSAGNNRFGFEDLLPGGQLSLGLPAGVTNKWHGHAEFQDTSLRQQPIHSRLFVPDTLVVRYHPRMDVDHDYGFPTALSWCVLRRDDDLEVWRGRDQRERPVALQYIDKLEWIQSVAEWSPIVRPMSHTFLPSGPRRCT